MVLFMYQEKAMLTFFHVTKLSNVANIRKEGLKVSSGLAAGGMSSDSSEAFKYAEQDKSLLYLWTVEDYTSIFKNSGASYAVIIVQVTAQF
ncbi:MAG: hypothetical protein HKN30_07905, partial [Sulfitobacter sp.]|nr:hypothetical protein [Sulfitobacter sp.]